MKQFKAPNRNEASRICIQREENWFQPLDQIDAILNNGQWNYEELPTGAIMPGYNVEKQSKCKKIGGDHDWNLMDFIRVEQHQLG